MFRLLRVSVPLALLGAIHAFAQSPYWQEDYTFAPAPEAISAPPTPTLIASPGGKAILSGDYYVNGQLVRQNPVRLNADGTTDATFAPSQQRNYVVVAVYSDSRVLATYAVPYGTSFTHRRLVRLLADGSLDSSFTEVDLSDNPRATILSDGRIAVYGGFTQLNGSAVTGFAVIHSDGTVDTSVHSTLTDTVPSPVVVNALLPDSSGKWIVTGTFNVVNGTTLHSCIARLNVDGTLDPTFDFTANPASDTSAIYPVPGGGYFLVQVTTLLKVTSAGAVDSTFTPQFVGAVTAIGPQQPDGKILYSSTSPFLPELRRLNVDGTSDPTLDAKTENVFRYFVLQPVLADDGSFFVPTGMTLARETQHLFVSHLHADGSIDTAYALRVGTYAPPRLMVAQSDGKLLLGGFFSYLNNIPAPTSYIFARVNRDGSTDTTFAPITGTAADTLSNLMPQPSGKIIAVGGGSTTSVTRYNADGTLDSSFTFPVNPSGAVKVDASGYIYAVSGATPTLARYTPDGALDATFQSAATGALSLLVAMPDGSVVTTQTLNGTSYYVRLRHDGSLDPTYQVATNAFVGSFAGAVALPDSGLLVCTIDGSSGIGTNCVLNRINSAGVVDYTYTGHQTGASSFEDYVTVGGAMYDLLLASHPAGNAVVQAWFSNGAVSAFVAADTTGRMITMTSWSGTDGIIHAWQRTNVAGPSFDATPTILSQVPSAGNFTVSLNQLAVLWTKTGGMSPVTLQWTKNGNAIAGATSNTLTIQSSQPTDEGNYQLTATNAYGSAASGNITMIVDIGYQTPVIDTPPADQTVAVGGDVTFTVVAHGTPTPTYQWQHGSTILAGATSASLGLTNVQLADAGTYSVAVSNVSLHANATIYSSANLTVNPPPSNGGGGGTGGGNTNPPANGGGGTTTTTVIPSVIGANDTQTIVEGATETFTITLAGDTPTSIAWKKDGTVIPGATSTTLTIAHVAMTDAGRYTFTATNAGGTATWYDDITVHRAAHLINLSTRVPAGGAAGTPICGFVIGGTPTLPVLLRGVGPTLAAFGLAGTMAEPTIKLHYPDGSTTTFSGWPADRAADMTAIGAFGLAAGGKDAATFLSLNGKYTAEIADAQGGAGVVMLETYDASGDTVPGAKLINASTLGFVGTDDHAMFTGFVVKGAGTVKVLIRAVGPSLTKFGIASPIVDPKIQIFQGSTKIGENDNWTDRTDGVSTTAIQAAATSVSAFTIDPGSKDAVILSDFAEGTYSAQITGVGGVTGTAIVELYVVP